MVINRTQPKPWRQFPSTMTWDSSALFVELRADGSALAVLVQGEVRALLGVTV